MVMAILAMAMAILAMGRRVSSEVAFTVSEMLREIGGDGPWKVRLDRIVEATQWADKAARNRIRHLIRFEQTPSPEQIIDIISAHAIACAEKLKARRAEDDRLKASIRRFSDLVQRADAAAFGPSIASYRRALERLRELDDRDDAEPRLAPGEGAQAQA